MKLKIIKIIVVLIKIFHERFVPFPEKFGVTDGQWLRPENFLILVTSMHISDFYIFYI